VPQRGHAARHYAGNLPRIDTASCSSGGSGTERSDKAAS